MKLIKKTKSRGEIDITLFFLLVIYCFIAFVLIVMGGCLLGRLLAYIKTGLLFMDWIKDIKYSLRVGLPTGVLTGAGIWIKAKLQARKDKSNPTE